MKFVMVILLVPFLKDEVRALPDRPSIHGVVKDPTDAVVEGARARLRTSQNSIIGSAISDENGRFAIENVQPGQYELLIQALGFAEYRMVLRLTAAEPLSLTIILAVGSIAETVTVSAEGGLLEDTRTSPQPVNVIDERTIQRRAKAVLAQAVNEEVGVHVQRTSPTIGGVFIRGLTGNKVNVFVDGVRYSTAAARGGINTFLDLIDPTNLETIEVLRGPRSADYGSDALAGSLQLVTRPPSLSPQGTEFHGSTATFFSTADTSFGTNLSLSYSSGHVGVISNLAGRRINSLRPGGGIDSHSAVTRYLGLPSTVVHSSRLPGSAFTQYGGYIRFIWAPRPDSTLNIQYQRGQQDGGKRYDQLIGGDGNLIADLRNLMLDFFVIRYDRQSLGWFSHVFLSYSYDTQREERVNQGGAGNPAALIVHEYERTKVHGGQIRADKFWTSHQLRFGGEIYHEAIRAPATGLDPITGGVTLRRPRVPDGARYRSWGLYVYDSFAPIANRLKLVGAFRYSGARYRVRSEDAPMAGELPLWPSESVRTENVSGRLGAWLRVTSGWSASANVGRGYRAPHITDLGTLGLTGSGFEAAAMEAAALGGQVGSTADRGAVSTGRPVTQVKSETNLTYDAGIRYVGTSARMEFGGFINDLSGLIEKQALILPPGAVGTMIGGEPIVAQSPNGTVFVAASSSPVLVRANFDDVRIWGIEHSFEINLSRRWSVGGVYTFIRAADKQTGDPPNVEGGTPAQDAWVHLRYAPARRLWVEPYIHAAGRQTRLSSLALEDRRIGATRTRESIARFFFNGATVRGLVGPGIDGESGTADDALLVTGETVTEVQARLLGPGGAPAPLFNAVPGYLTVNIRGGFNLSESQVITFDIENVTDRNYRGVSWGLDAPGRGFAVRYQIQF